MKWKPRLFVTLLFVAILGLSGCVSSAHQNNPAPAMLITKPILYSITVTPDGGICMDKHDAAALLIYIETIERAAGVGP